jgi:hypothetical protein
MRNFELIIGRVARFPRAIIIIPDWETDDNKKTSFIEWYESLPDNLEGRIVAAEELYLGQSDFILVVLVGLRLCRVMAEAVNVTKYTAQEDKKHAETGVMIKGRQKEKGEKLAHATKIKEMSDRKEIGPPIGILKKKCPKCRAVLKEETPWESDDYLGDSHYTCPTDGCGYEYVGS